MVIGGFWIWWLLGIVYICVLVGLPGAHVFWSKLRWRAHIRPLGGLLQIFAMLQTIPVSLHTLKLKY